MVVRMEQHSPAEELPALYRAILDRVAELERSGQRSRAAHMRADATRIYSRAWDESARRGLVALLGAPLEPPSEPQVSTRGVRSKRIATS